MSFVGLLDLPRPGGGVAAGGPPPLPDGSNVQGDGFEMRSVQFAPSSSVGQQASCFTSSKTWSSCDVYVTPVGRMNAGDTLIVKVYGITSGARALVASGRFKATTQIPAAYLPATEWVCAARAVAERFEVVIETGGITIVPVPEFRITSIASTRMDPAPEWVGVSPFTSGMADSATVATFIGGAEIVRVQAVNLTGAGPLYLMMSQRSTLYAGQPPQAMWPVGATAGAAIDVPFHFRMTANGSIALSTSPSVVTVPAAGAGAFQAFVR